MTPPATCSTDQRAELVAQIDASVRQFVDAGLIDATGWQGEPLIVTPIPAGDGVWYDVAAVERVVRFFLLLRHQKGRAARGDARFRLTDWQVRYLIAPVFGLKRPDGLRVIRTVWFEIPRKNGKSTLCSGIALYLLLADREPGAEVYAAAGDRDQANIVFGDAANMALSSPPIRRKLGKRGVQKKIIRHPVTNAVFRTLSSEGLRSHGLNVHGGVIDEVHVHRNPDVVDALETGVGAREQPLIVFITTADDGGPGTIYATKREEVETIAAGHEQAPDVWGVVFGVDDQAAGFDPFSDETLRAANPGYDVTVLGDYLRGKAAQAKRSPAQLNRYLRLHLNVRTKQTVRWLPLDRWDAGAEPLELGEWNGRIAVAGLDLSSTTDFTAAVVIARDDAGAVMVDPLFWLPEERLPDLERQTKMPLRRWAKEGHLLLTEGNVVDYRRVRRDFVDRLDVLGVELDEVAYDPWNATETVQYLEDDGFVMVPVRQGYASLSQPCKDVERLVFSNALRHSGHPVLRWHADVVEVRYDEGGNMKPAKPDRMRSGKRIDGMAALVNAVSRLEPEDNAGSVYDERGLEVVGG